MDFHINVNTILEGAILLGVAGIFRLIWGVQAHLAKVNGRLGKAEQWQELHQNQDDERHEFLMNLFHNR